MRESLSEMQPENVAPLFAPLHRALIGMLRQLPDEAWGRVTVARPWRVRDVTAHLLDGDLRKLSAHRDGHLHTPTGRPPANYAEVVALINTLNASGVSFAERLSPRLLVDLLDVTGRWVAEFVEQLDPFAPSLFPVAWAGETASQNWMDTGREYTERWHHQMQIRDAAGLPLLLTDEWFEPLLSFFLPRARAGLRNDRRRGRHGGERAHHRPELVLVAGAATECVAASSRACQSRCCNRQAAVG